MDLSIFAFPVNFILGIAFCVAVYLGYGWYKKSHILHSGVLTAVLIALIAALLVVEGVWKIGLQHRLVFLIPVLCAMFLVAFVTLDAIRNKYTFSFSATHLGFFLILFGTFFGAPDFCEVSLAVSSDRVEKYAAGTDGLTVPLGFGVRLKEFEIDYYDDLTTPKQYSSTIEILSEDKQNIVKTTSVNHPCLHNGWLIYQSDYDHTNKSFSVLRLVRDPWLPITFLGMALLALGALLSLRGVWRSRAVIPVALALAAVFGLVSVARINLGTLAPALRSLWFVPHLIIYMIAYSLLAIDLVYGIFMILRLKKVPDSAVASAVDFSRKLLATSSAMLIAGMLCGAVWAKIAWGDYWTWDPKECWAAVTWFITLAGAHLPAAGTNDNRLIHRKQLIIVIFVVLVSFLAMQVTWYGVNWLPSAQFSMHTYNS